MNLYREESSNAKYNAQRNLMGRTHYVDDDTLRFHHSRVLATKVLDGGLLFALIESCSLDMHNTQRGYRGVIFDIFGTVIDRPKLEEASSTRKAAERKLWETLNSINAVEHTRTAIERQRRYQMEELDALAQKVNGIEALKVSA